jgi:hypothetical protein
MNPLIKQNENKLTVLNGYELIDRLDGHIIAESHNHFALSDVAYVYEVKLGRRTDIRPRKNDKAIE